MGRGSFFVLRFKIKEAQGSPWTSMVDASVVYEKRLADTAGQLLLSDLNQLLRDVSTKRTSVACRYVAIVAISRNLYTQLLCCFKFQLLQRLISLWDN